ncbi:DUF3261 domain-containing protein [Arenimonas daejeonensis]|uniref:DUF3261 domain-containing protein n=1 Tax=Arenimonas daejeonensis TaxID=370777 RepID=UPI0013158346|nr:DUF3261 domain-containing protein [Arenimonas daejeonensis]
MFRFLSLVLSTTLLAACASAPTRAPAPGAMPPLRLAPAELGRELVLRQRLDFHHGERRESIEALVEVDAASVRLVMHAQGQVALRVDWNGTTLDQTRAEWLPPVLSGERVLDDLQLVYWPVAAINARLPAGWHLAEASSNRRLLQDGEIVATVVYVSATHVRLRQRRQGYVLDIHSVPVAP